MICMTIPANALIYGTFLNVSLASFAIFNTVSSAFVAVDSMYSRSVVDEITGGTSGIPWATIVFLCSRVSVDCPCASNGWSRVFEPITKFACYVLFYLGMDSAVEQHLRSDVSATILFFQQPSTHRKHVRKLVFVCT